MPISFNNQTVIKFLNDLDIGLRAEAVKEKYQEKDVEIKVVYGIDEVVYHVEADPTFRNLRIMATDLNNALLILNFEDRTFTSRSMSQMEIEQQLVVLMDYLIDGAIPRMIVPDKQENTNKGQPVDWDALIEKMPAYNATKNHSTGE